MSISEDLVKVKLPDGQIGTVPRSNLKKIMDEYGAVEVPKASVLSKIESAAKDIAMVPIDLGETVYKAGKQAYEQPLSETAKDIGYGLAVPAERVGQFILSHSPWTSGRTSALSKVIEPSKAALKASETPVGEVAGMVPAVATGGAAEEGVANLLGRLPLGRLTGAVSKAGALPVGGATAAIMTGQDPKEGALQNLILGGTLGVAGKGASKGLRAAIGGMGEAGPLKASELRERIKSIPKGLKVPLGHVAKSPTVKSLQEVLRLMPFSKMGEPEAAAHSYALESKENIAPKISPDDTYEALSHIGNEYYKKYLEQKERTNNAYNDLADALNDSDVFINDQPVNSARNLVNSELKKETRTKIGRSLYGNFKDYLSDYIPQFGNGSPHVDLRKPSELLLFRKQINNLMSRLDPVEQKQHMRWAQKIKNGIDESLEKSIPEKDENLYSFYKDANNERIKQGHFEKMADKKTGKLSNISTPFYSALMTGNKDIPTSMGSYIKPSTDKRLLNHLMSTLEKDDQNLVAGAALAHETLPQFMAKLGKFDKTHLKDLLKDKYEDAEELKNIKKLYPEFSSPNYLPRTGALGEKARALSLLSSAGIGGLLGGIPLEALASIVGGVGTGRAVSSALKSPRTAEMYARSLEGEPLTKGDIERVLRGTVVSTPQENLEDN